LSGGISLAKEAKKKSPTSVVIDNLQNIKIVEEAKSLEN
jgi:hypothetical protein